MFAWLRKSRPVLISRWSTYGQHGAVVESFLPRHGWWNGSMWVGRPVSANASECHWLRGDQVILSVILGYVL
jgi:hypothetical protein